MNNNQDDAPDRESLDDWLVRLRQAGSSSQTADTEDHVMYQAIVQHHQQQEAELLKDARSDDHAWQQMRFRLKKEGLLKSSNPWKTWVPMAMAAALLAAVALPSLMSPGIDVLESEPATLRGGGQTFLVQDPLNVAKAVAKELKPMDPDLKLHWYRSVATIDTDLKAADLDRAEAMLRSKVSAGKEVRLQLGFNRLEFSAAP